VDLSLLKSNRHSSTPPSSQSTEVTEKATRRKFTAKYKLRILEEADACTEPGEIGALLRREGLYASHLTVWREARRRGALGELAPKKRGPRAAVFDPRDKQIAELQQQLRKASARAERAEALVELQKKVSELLGLTLPKPPDDGSDS
jgi:transposase